MKRVFVAIKPDRHSRRQIQQIQDDYCQLGHRVHIDDLHITLAFIGDVSTEQVQALQHIMAGISVKPFSVHLNRLNYWENNGILSLIPDHMPSSLGLLQQKLQQGLGDNGFFVEKRKYFPHVTLCRQSTVNERNSTLNSVACIVDAYCLYESELTVPAPRYTIIYKKLLTDS